MRLKQPFGSGSIKVNPGEICEPGTYDENGIVKQDEKKKRSN